VSNPLLPGIEPQGEPDWRTLEWEIQDLFSPAAPINEASLIAGRRSQIERLTDAVFERGRHAILFGERGVGKTSLANTFHMMFASGLKSIASIRKPAFPSDTFSTLWKRVFNNIEIDGQPVSERYPGDITPDDVVKELAGFSRNTMPIIILDEFDKFIDIDSKRLMSHALKSISDEPGSTATIIIVGVAEDVKLLIEEHASISRNIAEIQMPRMSRVEMDEILDLRYPRVGIKIEDNARDNIVNLARGLPEYVHFLGRDAARSAVKNRRLIVTKDDVQVAIRNMVQNSDQTTDEAYTTAILSNKTNNLYRHVLLACALTGTDNLGRFTPTDVMPHLTRLLGRGIKIANFFPHIEAFCDQDRGAILEKKGVPKAYKYRFREPKMQPYVLMRSVADSLIPPEDILTL
jgi:Cdc6-like AAA superfamily ATPase